jgi:hypothetical protein
VAGHLDCIEENFRRIYLDGVPKLIVDGTAFLAFICVITGTEALCGYRYGAAYAPPDIGRLFKEFVGKYYPCEYHAYVDDLWELRNKLVHAFSTGRFLLTHHHPERHLTTHPTGGAPSPPVVLPPGTNPAFVSTGAPIDLRKYVTDLSGPISPTGNFIGRPSIILNAENFYDALNHAAERYFTDLHAFADFQEQMRARLAHSKGGVIAIQEIP